MQKYLNSRRDWIDKHDRDVSYEFEEKDELPGIKSHLLTYNGERKKFPKCLSSFCLWSLGAVMMDWILIFWFMRHSARLDYRFVKIATKLNI